VGSRRLSSEAGSFVSTVLFVALRFCKGALLSSFSSGLTPVLTFATRYLDLALCGPPFKGPNGAEQQ